MNKRVAIFTTHLIQYQIPFFKELAKQVNLHVFFGSKYGLNTYYDKDFNKKIKWDISLLKGYKYYFLKNNKKIVQIFFFLILLALKILYKKNLIKS